MLLARDAPDEHVQLAAVLGEPAGELFADQHVAAVGDDAQDAVDAVVVGDGDEVHPAAARLRVDLRRGAVALGAGDRVEDDLGGPVTGVAVAVQVDALAADVRRGGISDHRALRQGMRCGSGRHGRIFPVGGTLGKGNSGSGHLKLY